MIHKEHPELTDRAAKVLLAHYDKLKAQNFARITQAIVASNIKVKSPSLQELLTRYLQEHYNSRDFPAEIKVNLARIVDLASLDVKNFKKQIE